VRTGFARSLLVTCAVLASAIRPATAAEADPGRGIPSLAELEAAGARIGEIRVDTENIFDLTHPSENNSFYRLANDLHFQTRPRVILRALPFKSGEPFSARAIDEAERLLRANHFLYDADIRPVAFHDGLVDLQVTTRDTWTFSPSVNFSHSGGANKSGFALKEGNLLGLGYAIGLSHTNDIDRSSNTFSIQQDHAFGGGTSVGYSYADLTDGRSQSFALLQPFYSLESRRAYGISGSADDRVNTLYTNATGVAQARHVRDGAEVSAGWSDGLIGGFARRYSVGITYQFDTFRAEPGLPPPAPLPADQKLTAPFLRYEVSEDNFQKLRNRDMIERPEYFAMGLQLVAQVGRAMTALGGDRNLWLYSGTLSKGFTVLSDRQLVASASVTGEYGSAGVERELLSVSTRYYVPQARHSLLFVSIAGDRTVKPTPDQQLLLGGDNGLRGYPIRYQSGDRRALFTLEERIYTDWYPFRLFYVGGAAFCDAGRAWGGPYANTENTGWLGDVGIGLRLASARSASNHVLHADIAFPTHRDPGIRSVQFLIKVTSAF